MYAMLCGSLTLRDESRQVCQTLEVSWPRVCQALEVSWPRVCQALEVSWPSDLDAGESALSAAQDRCRPVSGQVAHEVNLPCNRPLHIMDDFLSGKFI